MIGDYEDDTHYCIKCHATIIGLDNYVTHRKTGCGKILRNVEELPKSPLPSQLLAPDESFSLKADDFFSSLELQSSSKKISTESTSGKSFSRILTRSKASAAIQASNPPRDIELQPSKSGKNAWIGGHQLKQLDSGDNQMKLTKAVENLSRSNTIKKVEPPALRTYEESDDDSDDYYYDEDSDLEDNQDAPPRSHTGGKWKPSNSPVQWTRPSSSNENWSAPPISFTGGKWKPYSKMPRNSPPPTHTKGKWKPASPNSQLKESYDAPRPSFTGGKWSASKALAKTDYVEVSSHGKDKWNVKSDEAALNDSNWDNDYISDDDCPPPGHTKGKWKPSHSDFPPPGHTKGKWKPSPSQDDRKESAPVPPPTYTKGKWLPNNKGELDKRADTSRARCYSITAPEAPPFRKSNGRVQYWCGPCNRRLASKIVYERHLKSDLHLKRTQQDREFDDSSHLNTNLAKENKRTKSEPVEYWTHTSTEDNKGTMKNAKQATQRIRRRIYVKCEVCRSRVHVQLMGKHLISHYHCRKGDITLPKAREMVLENIYSIVLQSPYQCATCRFFCNTQENFLRHWGSAEHKANVDNYKGFFWCSFCKHQTPNNAEMFDHLVSKEHNEVIFVINRSVPIVIKKINPTECQTCRQIFLLNIQLRKHCERENHPQCNTGSDAYQNKHACDKCSQVFKSKVALQRHKKRKHLSHVYICSTCDLNFGTLLEAKLHRRTSEHRYAVQAKKNKTVSSKSALKGCQYCSQKFENMLLLKKHLKEKHAEYSHSCPRCAKTFIISQELTVHLRTKACNFQQKPENANKCDQCPFSTASSSELLFHKVLHTDALLVFPDESEKKSKRPIEKYKCPICEKFFAKLSLRCHIRLHTRERPYSCSICNATFIRKNNWALHMKNCKQKDQRKVKDKRQQAGELGERPYLCSTCGASFKKKSILQLHMMRHTGKLCKCPEEGCVFSARTPAELKPHLLVHSDLKPFACTQCEYKGKTKQQLDRHKMVHEETKKYQCSQCPFSARLSSHLKRHIRLHTGAKPFSCPHCKYRCNNLENLRKHVLSTNKHPGKCIYECKFCSGRNFQTNFARDFKVHLVTEHSDMFQTGTEAATYVSGIYEAADDASVDASTDLEDKGCDTQKHIPSIYQLEYQNSLKATTSTAYVSTELLTSVNTQECIVESKGPDEFFPLYIIPKDEIICIENTPDSWSMVGSYDVEESGALVPFTPDGETLFQEHFQ